MPRSRPGAARHKRKRRLLRAVRGYHGPNSRSPRAATTSILRAGVYAFRDRRARKRNFRSLWIIRLTAACRARGVAYSRFIRGLQLAGIELNRKMLSEMAIHHPADFDLVVDKVKASLEQQAAA